LILDFGVSHVSAQNDASFMRMFIFILALLVAFTVAILFVANSMTAGSTAQQAGDKRLKAEIAERIAPIGSVVTFNPNAAPAAARDGATVVKIACASCHASGALGAPKIGDKSAWGGRMGASGLDGLVKSAIAGKGNMPPRGGSDASDEEIRNAIVDMLKNSDVSTGQAKAAAAAPVSTAKQVVAKVATTAKKVVAAAAGPDIAKGKKVYDSACFVCHMSGAAGSPKLGDKGAWSSRIAAGMDSLYNNAIKGKGGMPPKGGRMELSDDDVKAAVAYMVEQSK
jgi:cytochrome c5